jgi:hypothetical protein
MPELVACPVCDCRILVNEMQLGRRIRCINCERPFVAGEARPVQEPTSYSLHPTEVVDEEPAVVGRGVEPARHRLPLCPKCHRPVEWNDLCCAHCGHLFDPEDSKDRASWQARRDALAHQGELIGRLGRYALLGGGLAVCTGPLGALFAVGCGVPAWWMAHNDLAGMDAERIDPSGRDATEEGKNSAVAGLILALVSSVFWILVIITYL